MDWKFVNKKTKYTFTAVIPFLLCLAYTIRVHNLICSLLILLHMKIYLNSYTQHAHKVSQYIWGQLTNVVGTRWPYPYIHIYSFLHYTHTIKCICTTYIRCSVYQFIICVYCIDQWSVISIYKKREWVLIEYVHKMQICLEKNYKVKTSAFEHINRT